MPTKKNVLFSNRWITVHELEHKLSDGTVLPYTSVRDGNGMSVAMLPYRIDLAGNVEFLVRREITPPWTANFEEPNQTVMSSMTGMVDDGEIPLDAAVREIYEESGYVVDRDSVVSLGEVFRSKASESKTYLFTVDVTGKTPAFAPGDGTGFEDFSRSVWVRDIVQSPDAIIHTMSMKMHYLGLISAPSFQDYIPESAMPELRQEFAPTPPNTGTPIHNDSELRESVASGLQGIQSYPARDDFTLIAYSAIEDPVDPNTAIKGED